VATAVLLGSGMLAAACASAAPAASGQAAGTPDSAKSSQASSPAVPSSAPSSPAASPSDVAAAGCATSVLKAVVNTSQGGGAAGSVYYPIDFTNTSSSTCTLYGYPGVSFTSGRGGSQIGRPASRNPAGPPVTVTLTPGGVAHATVQVAQAGNYAKSACKPVTAHWLKIFPPNQTAPLYVRFTTQACSHKVPSAGGSQLSIYSVREGPGLRGQAP
jgi:hypothetical protein